MIEVPVLIKHPREPAKLPVLISRTLSLHPISNQRLKIQLTTSGEIRDRAMPDFLKDNSGEQVHNASPKYSTNPPKNLMKEDLRRARGSSDCWSKNVIEYMLFKTIFVVDA